MGRDGRELARTNQKPAQIAHNRYYWIEGRLRTMSEIRPAEQ